MRTHLLTGVIGAGVLTLLGSTARAQEDPLQDLGDPVARVQADYVGLSDEDRAELVLLPVLAEMDPLPDGASVWVTPDDAGWSAVLAWIESEAQRAVIEAVETTGAFDARMVWGLGYGESNAHADLAGNPLVPRLTNGTYLAGMSLGYIDALKEATWLVHFEALRRASEGNGLEALKLEAAMLRTWRLIADRAMYDEVEASFELMTTTLEMMRDLMYLYPESASPEELKEVIGELDKREVRIDRVRFPMGDKLAFQHLVRDSFHRFSKPDPSTFGPLMAQIATGEQSLQLFGESDWWVRALENHGDYYTTSDAIDAVFGDWEFRWSLDPFDHFHTTQSDYMRLDPAANAMLLLQLKNQEDLITSRNIVSMELDATRLSLGCVGYKQKMNDYPSPLFAIRPEFVREIDVDPYGEDFDEPYLYFVPIRDQVRGAREAPTPHAMRVSTEGTVGDQRLQINNMVRIPDSDAYLSLFPSEELKKITRDLENLAVNSGGSNAPLVISKASGLYDFLSNPCDTMARQTQISLEVKEKLLDDARKLLQEHDVLRQTVERSRGGRELARSEFINLLDTFTAEFAFQLRLHQNSTREQSFIDVTLGRDSFVLYSAGINEENDLAREVGLYGTDYLLWPPMISLVREHRDALDLE